MLPSNPTFVSLTTDALISPEPVQISNNTVVFGAEGDPDAVTLDRGADVTVYPRGGRFDVALPGSPEAYELRGHDARLTLSDGETTITVVTQPAQGARATASQIRFGAEPTAGIPVHTLSTGQIQLGRNQLAPDEARIEAVTRDTLAPVGRTSGGPELATTTIRAADGATVTADGIATVHARAGTQTINVRPRTDADINASQNDTIRFPKAADAYDITLIRHEDGGNIVVANDTTYADIDLDGHQMPSLEFSNETIQLESFDQPDTAPGIHVTTTPLPERTIGPIEPEKGDLVRVTGATTITRVDGPQTIQLAAGSRVDVTVAPGDDVAWEAPLRAFDFMMSGDHLIVTNEQENTRTRITFTDSAAVEEARFVFEDGTVDPMIGVHGLAVAGTSIPSRADGHGPVEIDTTDPHFARDLSRTSADASGHGAIGDRAPEDGAVYNAADTHGLNAPRLDEEDMIVVPSPHDDVDVVVDPTQSGATSTVVVRAAGAELEIQGVEGHPTTIDALEAALPASFAFFDAFG